MNVLATFYAADFFGGMTWNFLCSFHLSVFFFFQNDNSPAPKLSIAISVTCLTPIHLSAQSFVLVHALCLQNEKFKRDFKRIE